MSKKDLCELIQDDIITCLYDSEILDIIDSELISRLCQIVVHRFKEKDWGFENE